MDSYKINQKSYLPVLDKIERKWWLVDAAGLTLGRIATRIARRLQGKDKALYTPFFDCGDFVVIINAAKINLSGNKPTMKVYKHYSGYPGGLKETKIAEMLKKKPEYPLFHAIKGMLPNTKLGAAQLKKLKIYGGENHPHQSQDPVKWELK